MVTLEQAQCPNKKWFSEDRCSQYKESCDISADGNPCDFKNLPYDSESIKQRLKADREDVMRMMLDKKILKKEEGKKKELEVLENKMVDKTIGIMIMQDALVRDFGASMSLNDKIKALREVKRWKKQLKS